VRRTVATLLVVASPLLLAAPVSAQPDRPSMAVGAVPAGPSAVPGVGPVAPAPVAPAPVTLAEPSVHTPGVAPAVAPPAVPIVARPTVKKVSAAHTPGADLNDTAYAARLQADLCQARQIFCGLDRSGHYPAG
jgi:hypothetical protein